VTETEEALAAILADLRRWAGLPKYSVERRLDLFLAPFIPMYLADKLGCPGQVELVVPELPLRHGDNFQTVNADYLLLRKGAVRTWFLVELKTDPASVEEAQARLYAAAAAPADGRPAFRKILDDLPLVMKHCQRTALKEKYRTLIRYLEAFRTFEEAPVRVFYVSPSIPRARPWRHVRLPALAAWTPPRYQALWKEIAKFLVALGVGAPAKGAEVPWHRSGMGSATVERVLRDADRRWTGVELSYQAGRLVVPDPEHPGHNLDAPVVTDYIDREVFLESERRFDERQWESLE
jgi:hypothetical protein